MRDPFDGMMRAIYGARYHGNPLARIEVSESIGDAFLARLRDDFENRRGLAFVPPTIETMDMEGVPVIVNHDLSDGSWTAIRQDETFEYAVRQHSVAKP